MGKAIGKPIGKWMLTLYKMVIEWDFSWDLLG